MTDLYLNGVLVDLPTDANIKIIQENPYFTKSSSYTYNIALPLRSKINQKIFKHVNREDVAKRAVTFNATLISLGQTLLRGTATITEIKDETVQIQLLAGNAEFNFFAKSENVYIDEIDMGTCPTPGPSEYIKLVDFKPKYTKQYSEGGIGVVLPVWNKTDQKIYNYMVADLTGTTPYYYWANRSGGYVNICAQPYLCYVIKKVVESIGYTLELNEIENTIYKNLYVPSVKVTDKYQKALPHWTISDFVSHVENFMGMLIVVDEDTKKVKFLFNKSYYNTVNPVTIQTIADESATTIDVEETKDVTDGNIGYTLSGWDDDNYKKLSDDVLDSATINHYDTYALLVAAFNSMTYNQKKKIIFEAENRRYIVMKDDTSEYLFEVDQWRNLIRYPAQKDLDVELKIVPAEMIESSIKLSWGFPFNEGNALIPVLMPALSGSTYVDDTVESLSLQDIIDGEYNEEDKTDIMPVAFFYEYQTISSDEHVHYYPIPWVDYKNDLFPGLPMWSLRLVGTSAETYLGANSHTGIVKVNSAVEETKIVISRKKFDPKAVYIINNKRYVCKKIEMTVTATGPAPTQRFILYELLE